MSDNIFNEDQESEDDIVINWGGSLQNQIIFSELIIPQMDILRNAYILPNVGSSSGYDIENISSSLNHSNKVF
jgi:hypothetical protein